MKKLLALGLTGMLLTPMVGLLGVGVLVNPAVINQAHCIATGITLGPIPDSLQVTAKDGSTFTLNRQQLTHAATIITVGSGTPGVGRDGILIAIMAALTDLTWTIWGSFGVLGLCLRWSWVVWVWVLGN